MTEKAKAPVSYSKSETALAASIAGLDTLINDMFHTPPSIEQAVQGILRYVPEANHTAVMRGVHELANLIHSDAGKLVRELSGTAGVRLQAVREFRSPGAVELFMQLSDEAEKARQAAALAAEPAPLPDAPAQPAPKPAVTADGHPAE